MSTSITPNKLNNELLK